MCLSAILVFVMCLGSGRQLSPFLSLSVMAGFHIIVSSHPPKPSVPIRVPAVGCLSVSTTNTQGCLHPFILSSVDLLTCLSMYKY